MSIIEEQNSVIADIHTIIAKAKKAMIQNTIDSVEFEKYKDIIEGYINNPSFDFKRKTIKVLAKWYQDPVHYFFDIKGIAEGLRNLLNNQIANNTDTTIIGCDNAHKGYRHFHTNGQTRCEYSVVYYKNKKTNIINVVTIDNHKDLKIGKNNYPNITSLK